MKKRSPRQVKEEIANWYFSDAELQEVASMIVDVDHGRVHRGVELDAEDTEEEDI